MQYRLIKFPIKLSAVRLIPMTSSMFCNRLSTDLQIPAHGRIKSSQSNRILRFNRSILCHLLLNVHSLKNRYSYRYRYRYNFDYRYRCYFFASHIWSVLCYLLLNSDSSLDLLKICYRYRIHDVPRMQL